MNREKTKQILEDRLNLNLEHYNYVANNISNKDSTGYEYALYMSLYESVEIAKALGFELKELGDRYELI